MTKEYKISYNEHGYGINMECQVRIDHSIADPKIKETLEFFAGTKQIIKDWNGETKAFLAMLGERLTYIGVKLERYIDNGIEKVRSEIQDTEGWDYLSPEYGITITTWYFEMDIDQADMTVAEIEKLRKEVPNA